MARSRRRASSRRRTPPRRKPSRRKETIFVVPEEDGGVAIELPDGTVTLGPEELKMFFIFSNATLQGDVYYEGFIEKGEGGVRIFRSLIQKGFLKGTRETSSRIYAAVSSRGDLARWVLAEVVKDKI